MSSNRRAPGRSPGRSRSALTLIAAGLTLGPAAVFGCRDFNQSTPILAEDLGESSPSFAPGSGCDDGNPCTKDSILTNGCRHDPVERGIPCSDGDVCNGLETCDGQGTCAPGAPLVINDGNECTQDSCDPLSGLSHTLLPGHACTDQCGVVATCGPSGTCGAGALDDSNPCTADWCDPVHGVTHESLPAGASCDDGELCNGIDTCDGFGTCNTGTPPAEGTSCSDGNPCNGAETCVAGTCSSGLPPRSGAPCDDHEPCTELDACDGSFACVGVAVSDGTSCSDGNPCTGGDSCSSGRCLATSLSGTSCGDGDACNGAEACVAGECVAGTPALVDDGDPVTIDACDPVTGYISHAECAPTDLTVTTTLSDMVRCLHEGASPPQTGLTETIDPLRVAAVHGSVAGADGEPLAGVSVTLRRRIPVGPNNSTDAPQLTDSGFGHTVTRDDGSFDLALNSGTGSLVLDYSRPGYLSSQREITPERGRFVTAPDVVLLRQDPAVSTVEIGAGVPDIQIARGSVVSDTRGTRQVTLFFQPGTVATTKMPNGSSVALPAGEVHVRATEYTAGLDGPKAMPGTLPPTTAYTYAVDLNLDEAIAAGAASVTFDPPVIAYLENFIGLPPGENMPSGAYRPDAGLWEVQTNGRVIQLVDVTKGKASLDIDPDPGPESDADLAAFGISAEERERLAELYAPGQTLWRVPVAHFSPWDWNLGFGAVAGAEYPNQLPKADNPGDDQCTQKGSIIGCEARSLGEAFGVVGTPFTLHYQSDRSQGYQVPIRVPATGATLPNQLISVTVELDVAGQHQSVKMPPAPDINLEMLWDGKNALGQIVQGPQAAEVSIGYEFPRAYAGAGAFGGTAGGGVCPGCIASGGGGGVGRVTSTFASVPVSQTIMLWQRHRLPLHHFNAVHEGFGGLTLDVHHVYDPSSAVLYRGDGSKRSGESLVSLSTYAGGGNSQANNIPAKTASLVTPRRLAQGPDGSIYIAESTGAAAKIVKVDTAQVLTNVWTGQAGTSVLGLAVGGDGSVYFSVSSQHRVYRIPPGGAPIPFAGDGTSGSSTNGAIATSTHLNGVSGLAIGPDGSVYLADTGNHEIDRVDVEGKLWRVAGMGFCFAFRTSAECGDGGVAKNAYLNQPTDLSIGADGTLYFADTGTNRIRAVTPDGVIHRVAGLAQGTNNNNQVLNQVVSGIPAKAVKLNYPLAAAIAPDGALYITEQGNGVVRRIDPPLITLDDETSDTNGKIRTVAGSGLAQQFSGEGGLATAAGLPAPYGLLAAGDGTLFVADMSAGRVLQVRPAMPGLSLAKTSVVSDNGAEIYVFDEERRHEKTIDSMTGRVLYMFEYDAAHLLKKITDAEGRETQVVRTAGGDLINIVGPLGHATTIHLAPDGYASDIIAPDSSLVHLAYTGSGTGLLASLTDPRGFSTTFSYNARGRLNTDIDPAGNVKSLTTLLDDATHHSVAFTTPEGRVTTYNADLSDPTVAVHMVTGADGLTATTTKTQMASQPGSPGSQAVTTLHDGTTVTLEDGPDPRLGLQAPFAKKITTTSGGVTQTVTRTRTVIQAPNDLTNVSQLTDQTSINNGAPWTSHYQRQPNGGAVWTRTSPMGRQGSVELDPEGRVTAIHTPGIAPVVMSYMQSGPNKGRVYEVSQTFGGSSRTTSFSYDNAGNLVEATSPLNHTTYFSHDAHGRVVHATTPDGRTFHFQRDVAGNVTTVEPPSPGGDHHFSFDARGFVTNYTPSDLGQGDESTSYTYSGDGLSTLTLLPSGATIGAAYDSAGRPTSVQMSSGSTQFSYFGSGASKGKLSSVMSPDGVAQSLTYQGALLSDIVWTGPVLGSLHYTYDSQFRASSETVGGSTIYRNWNLDGQLTSAGILQISYDAQSGIPQGTTAGAVHDGLTWNAFGEPTSYQVWASQMLLTRSFQRDVEGRITQVSELSDNGTTVDQVYTYDLAGRLTDVVQDGVSIAHYDYDAHGNRTSTVEGGQPPKLATFDAQDRILTYGDETFTHAITGERLSKVTPGVGTTTYSYDEGGQLKGVTLPDGTSIAYLYDAAGRRVAKKLNGTFVQRFLYGEADGPAALVSANGAVLERYAYATSLSVPDYVVKTTGNQAGTYRLIKDERGSVRLVVDTTTAAIVQRIDYDAYGRILSDTNPGFTPFGFGGGLWDADTELVRFGLRDYDPATGRWTTQDPIGLAGGDANLYAYVGCDPVNGIDPSGLMIETDNVAMNSALNGGALAWLGFAQFAEGAYNFNNGVLELSNDGTFEQGIKDIRKGACQMVAGGIDLATNTAPTAAAAASLLGTVITALPRIASKAVSLPAWRKIVVDMPHILERHVPGAKYSAGRTVFPSHMNERAIEAAVREAYRFGAIIGGQGERVLVAGGAQGLTIEMWVNKFTKIIETAYPVFP